MRYLDLNGLAWQQLGNALSDALAVVWWTLVAGFAASGACWSMGQFAYTQWVRDHPPPRLRFLAERRLRRDIARGLADLAEYLGEQDPAHLNDGRPPRQPGPPRRGKAGRRPNRPRADR